MNLRHHRLRAEVHAEHACHVVCERAAQAVVALLPFKHIQMRACTASVKPSANLANAYYSFTWEPPGVIPPPFKRWEAR